MNAQNVKTGFQLVATALCVGGVAAHLRGIEKGVYMVAAAGVAGVGAMFSARQAGNCDVYDGWSAFGIGLLLGGFPLSQTRYAHLNVPALAVGTVVVTWSRTANLV